MSIQQGSGGSPLLEEDEERCEDVPKEASTTVRSELLTMFNLAWPMIISFVCRIGMASTDTAFVGHLTNTTCGAFLDEPHSAEQYLAAASLSDMVVNILIVPPLAFNQVLNALVGQALGSGNKKMAGTWLQLSIFFLTASYLPFMVCQYLFVADALRLLGFSHEVAELAGSYARWNLFWPIPNGIYQCMCASDPISWDPNSRAQLSQVRIRPICSVRQAL